jgi:hypothetical protein
VGWAALAVVVVVLAGLAGIDWMWRVAPVQAPPGLIASPPSLPVAPAEQPSQAPEPAAVSDKRLTFKVTNHGGQGRTVTCTVRREDYARELATFGVDDRFFWQEVNAAVKAALDDEAKERGVARLFSISVVRRARPIFRRKTVGMPQELTKKAESFADWLNGEGYLPTRRAIIVQAFRKRGFVLIDEGDEATPDRIQVDYKSIVNNATGPVADCARELRKLGASAKGHQLAGLFLAFFQGMEDMKDKEIGERDKDGRLIGGFRVPTAVLVEQAGDCDSKGAAFCAMWRQQVRDPVLLALDRKCGRGNHALVGVRSTGEGECEYRLGKLNFVLHEVVGGVRPCPCASEYDYVLIEPAGAG